MIIILCDDFGEAQNAFNIFHEFLEKYEPTSIIRVDPYSLRVLTDDDLIYTFIDYRMVGIFKGITEDVMEEDEFFEDLFLNYGASAEEFNYGWIPW